MANLYVTTEGKAFVETHCNNHALPRSRAGCLNARQPTKPLGLCFCGIESEPFVLLRQRLENFECTLISWVVSTVLVRLYNGLGLLEGFGSADPLKPF